MTSVTLACDACGLMARRELRDVSGSRGVREARSGPATCPTCRRPMRRVDGRAVAAPPSSCEVGIGAVVVLLRNRGHRLAGVVGVVTSVVVEGTLYCVRFSATGGEYLRDHELSRFVGPLSPAQAGRLWSMAFDRAPGPLDPDRRATGALDEPRGGTE